MGKKFEEMPFEELKLYRREGLWRSLGTLLVVIIVILGMILMEAHHVPSSNAYRFRTLGIMVIIGLLGYLRPLANANRVMREHPDWIRQSGLSAQIPLPKEWHLKRAFVIGGALVTVMIGFVVFYQPQEQNRTNIPAPSTPSSIMNQNDNTYYSGLQSISKESNREDESSSTMGGE